MTRMEITARELRDVEIREAFRGYHRDDVNDLLERAAATIDAANERVRQMSERLSTAQVDSGRSRETEDILHRTLLLAQRAADEAVAEAQAKARAMVDDAEVQSRRTIADAEAEARLRGETEKRRLEQEVVELAQQRDALTTDIETLSRYESEYRDRLLRALETDLETLRGRTAVAPGPKPETHEIDLPAMSERIARRDEDANATREIDMRAVMDEPSTTTSTPTGTPSMSSAPPPPVVPAPTGPAAMAAPSASASANSNGTATATEERMIDLGEQERAEEQQRPPAPIDLLAAEGAMDAEVLDDEAFFATLREAVHDEAPLGPRDEEQGSSLFDQDEDEVASFKDVFRRRR
jgi:DivIVA domain-containing protein